MSNLCYNVYICTIYGPMIVCMQVVWSLEAQHFDKGAFDHAFNANIDIMVVVVMFSTSGGKYSAQKS